MGFAAPTVTVQVAVLSSLTSSVPLVAVTVIVAVPTATAVTTPSETVATLSLSLNHVTVLSVASSGLTVAASFSVSPTVSVVEVLLRVTSVTATDDCTASGIVTFTTPVGVPETVTHVSLVLVTVIPSLVP